MGVAITVVEVFASTFVCIMFFYCFSIVLLSSPFVNNAVRGPSQGQKKLEVNHGKSRINKSTNPREIKKKSQKGIKRNQKQKQKAARYHLQTRLANPSPNRRSLLIFKYIPTA